MPSAGVSNFDLSELRELWLMVNVKPAVVQRNSDPLNPDTLVQQYARLTGIQYQVGINALWAHISSGLPPWEAPVMITEKRKLFFSGLTSSLTPLDPSLFG